MKVCCITLTETPNYGAVLQAYALKEYVCSLGHEYTLLNYENEAQRLKFSFWGHTEFMNWKYNLYKKIHYPINKYRIKQIVSFQHEHGNLSQLITRDQLPEIANQYDAFISGSDQVWNNPEVNHYDETFFLRFADGKNTISYAASFGKTADMLSERDETLYRENIGRIRHISVREDSGRDIVKKYSGRDSQWVCDPVFLLSQEEWRKIIKVPRKDKYILVYLIGNAVNQTCNKMIMAEAKKMGRRLGLPLVKISRGLSSMISECSFSFPKTEEWLGLIANAELIITNSFHGTSFASIFKKNFICFVDGNENNKMNTRIYSILRKLALEDRLVSINNPGDYYNHIETDYTEVEPKMRQFIEESKRFIKESLEAT